MVQNLISGLDVCQQLNEANLISGGIRECPNDKIEVVPGKSCPTVGLNHRVYLHSIIRAGIKPNPARIPSPDRTTGDFPFPGFNCILLFSPVSMPIRPFQFFKWLTLLSLTLLLAWVAYYYYHQGFGRHWRALLSKEFHAFGLEIRVRRLTLDPFRGLVAKDLEIYDNDRRQTILAQISDLSLDINYANLLTQEPALNAVDLHDARISIPIDPAAPKEGRIRLTGLQSRIYFFPGRIEVRQASGMIFGIHLQASGTLVNPAAFSLLPVLDTNARSDQKLQQNFLRLLIKEISMLHFSGEPPQLAFTFQVDLASPTSLRLQEGHLFAETLTRQNYQLQNLDCQFSLENQKFDLRKFFIRDGRGELFATGDWNLATGEKNFQVRSGLDPAKLLANDSRFLWAKELVFDAPPEIEVSGMAGPDGHLQVLGNLNFDQFSVRNVKFQSMKAEFSKLGNSWMVMNAQVTHHSGTLSGDVLNRPGEFRMRINSALNPTELLPLCPPRLQRALTDWEFQTSPVIQATFSGANPEFAKISGNGQIWLGKTKFRGALVNSASADCELRNNVLRCDQVRVIRDEGVGTGRFAFDLGQDQLTIEDVETNLSPGIVAAWINPSIGRILQPFRFTVTPTIHAAGTVQLRRGSTDDLRIRVDSQSRSAYQFDGWEIPFEQGSADFSMVGGEPPNLEVNGTMSVKGAKVSGSKFLATLLTRLEPLGFREPVDSKLNFKLDAVSLQMTSFQIVSGSHSIILGGSLFFPGDLVDLTGDVDGGSVSVRCVGTIQAPIWELILPVPK